MSEAAKGRTSPKVGLVVVAAGSSRRFGSDKLSAYLAGQTTLQRAVGCLRDVFPDAPLAVVVRPEAREARARELAGFGVSVFVPGGRHRQDSVRAGVEALNLPPEAVVVIHDGARPFVPAEDVRGVVAAAQESGAAVLAAPLTDTIKEVNAGGWVVRTLPRERLVRSLTPQAFRVGLLQKLWNTPCESVWTDEASALESANVEVRAVFGDARNLKITHPQDVSMLSGLFPPSLRVGQGVDVHPLAAGRPLVLAGIPIPYDRGLVGHSDADVVLHAVTDAILGACGAEDIGHHFPPSDPRWAGAPSSVFLEFALTKAREGGFSVANCDVTVLAEQPRLAPFRDSMRANLARMLGLPPSAVNLKATTTERMGFVGRGEGVAAVAVVLLVGR